MIVINNKSQIPKIQQQQMINSQAYISLYNSLTNSKTSQQANQQLIKLQQKDESWKIAKQLIANNNYHIHGCQLLSKKLNRPYTMQQQVKYKLVQFITSLPVLNKTLYLCLAKLALQLNWQSVEPHLKQPYNSLQTVLNILKCVPSASAVVRLAQNYDERQITMAIFNNYKQLLTQIFGNPKYINDAIQIIQNFIQNGYKLRSQMLLRCLLTQPIQKVSEILQNILISQKYENMSNQIYQYLLHNNNNKSQYFIVLIAFASSLDLLNLNVQVIKYIFTKILQNMHKQNTLNIQQRKNVSYIIDAFQFWSSLPQKINKQLLSMQKKQQIKICMDAFVELWKIIIQRSIQYEMPKFKQSQNVDNLVISLDDDDQYENIENILQRCVNNSKFRNTAQDFLTVCYGILCKNKQYERKALSFLFQLTKSDNPLHLQLAIFVMSSIVQSATQSIQQINALMESITQNNNAKSPYIWQQLIKLIGKLGHQTICDNRIFKTALIVLKQSIQIKQLSCLAAQNLNQILQTCNNSSQKQKQIQVPILQQLFDYIYANIYFQTNDEKLFQKLTKSTILFIYYFKPNPQYFKQYLQALNIKIQAMAQIQDRCEIIQNLAICHNFILSQYSLPFISILSQFLVSFMPVIISQIDKCKQNKRMNKLMNKLAVLINIGGGYYTEIWVEGLIILFNMQKIRQQKTNIIILLNKLITVQNYDTNYHQSISKLINNNKIIQYITISLLQSSQSSIKLINNCLTFHFNILSKYINLITQYNPDRIIDFIINKIYKNYLRYQYESTKISLAILRNVIQKNYHIQLLLEETLKVYSKLVDLLWKSLQAVLCQAYKIGGTQIYQRVFRKIYPSVLPPNPLFDVLMNAFKKSNSKDVKNLLASLN